MQLPFLPCISHVFFHSFYRKTTVHKNGHNFRYAHSLLNLIRLIKLDPSVFYTCCFC